MTLVVTIINKKVDLTSPQQYGRSAQAEASGIASVIHKAIQGTCFVDSLYQENDTEPRSGQIAEVTREAAHGGTGRSKQEGTKEVVWDSVLRT